MDAEYENNLDVCFYIYLLFYKRTPDFLSSLCCLALSRKRTGHLPTYEERLNHFDELKKQVRYQISLRNFTTNTLLGQITEYKANVLSTNEQDELASIQVVVDEIWHQFDVDFSGVLDKTEIRQFVLEYLPEFRPDFTFSENEFERVFAQFDLDGNGVVDKTEMTEFIKHMLTNDL